MKKFVLSLLYLTIQESHLLKYILHFQSQ